MRRTWSWLLSAALFSSVAGAQPSNSETEARTFFNIGAKAYQAGKYLDAARAFEQAYKRAQRPGLLFSLGQSHRMQFFADNDPARLRDAVRYYREYLQKDPKGNRRGEATEALAKLSPLLERLQPASEDGNQPPPPTALTETKPSVMISSPTAGVRIKFDGKPRGELPFISEVPPGKHRFTLSAPGFEDYSREISVDKRAGAPPLDIPLQEKPAVLSVRAPAGAEITIDGRPQGTTPSPPMKLSPGRHFIAITMNGREAFTKELNLRRGEKREVSAELRSTGQRTLAWVLMGGGAAGLLTGGALGLVAYKKQRDATTLLDQAEGPGNLNQSQASEYDSLRDDRDRFRLYALVSAGAGVALGTTGFVLYAFDEPRVSLPSRDEGPLPAPKPEAPASPGSMEISATPLLNPGFYGGALHGRF